MITRITNQTIQHSTLANLQMNLTKMATLQAQMSSGAKISVASDDPAAASDMLRLRGEQRVQDQYVRSASDGNSWLTTVDSSIQSSLTTLRNVRDLTVQSGDVGLGQSSREALATEIDGLRDTMLSQANATYLGRTVFAGTSNAGKAFDPTTYAFTGSPTAKVERTIGPATTVRVDADGSAVYGDGAGSVFALFDKITTTLRSGGDATAYLGQMDTHLEAMLSQVASTGARQTQVNNAQTELTSAQLTTKMQLSGIEDIDLAETIMQIKMQETAYQGSLGAAQKVMQPSLMDFLK